MDDTLELTSQWSFFEMFTKKNHKLPCLIPQTIMFDKSMPKIWLFNPQKETVVLKKNSDKLSNVEIARVFLGLKKDLKLDTLGQLLDFMRVQPQLANDTTLIAYVQPMGYVSESKRKEATSLNKFEFLQYLSEGKELSSLSYIQEHIDCQNEVYYVDYTNEIDFLPPTFKFIKKTLTIPKTKKTSFTKTTNPFQPFLAAVQSAPKIPVKTIQVQKVFEEFKFLDSTLNMKFQEETKKIVLFFEKVFKIRLRRFIPKFIVSKTQQIYFIGIKKLYIQIHKLAPYQKGLKDEIASNGTMENFMISCKQFSLDKNAKNEFNKYPNQIVEEDKQLSKTLYKHMILEKCSGDFCNYKLIEKNKGPLQLRKGLLDSYKNVFKESKQTVSNMSTHLPYEISLQLIVRTRDDHKEVIEMFRKYKIHLENYNPEEHSDAEQQHPFSKLNSDVQALINLYKSVKICKNCFIIYSMIQRHFEQQLNKDIKNGAQFINEKKTSSSPNDEAERRRIREENIKKRQEKLQMKPSTSSSTFRIFRAPTQKRNFLITSIPDRHPPKTASPIKGQNSQIEINRLTLGYLNYQKLEQFQKSCQFDMCIDQFKEPINLIHMYATQTGQIIRRIEQQENKELIIKAEEIKKILQKTSKKEQDCRTAQKEYYDQSIQNNQQQTLIGTTSHYYYHVNTDIIRKLYQYQLSTPMQALTYEFKYDQLKTLTIEQVCNIMNYPQPTIDIELQYLILDAFTAIPYLLLESSQIKKREKGQHQSGIEVIVILHDMFESLHEYYSLIKQLATDYPNKKFILLNIPGQSYTVFSRTITYTNIYIAQILDQILFELTIQKQIDLQTDTLKIIGIGAGGFYAQAFIVQSQQTIQFSSIILINSFSKIYPQFKGFLIKSKGIFESQPIDMPELAFEYTNTIMNTQQMTQEKLHSILQQNPISNQGRLTIIDGLLNSPAFQEKFQKLILSVQVYHSLKNCLINIQEAELLQTFIQDETLDVNNVALSKKIQQNKRSVTYIEGGHSILYENQTQLMQLMI